MWDFLKHFTTFLNQILHWDAWYFQIFTCRFLSCTSFTNYSFLLFIVMFWSITYWLRTFSNSFVPRSIGLVSSCYFIFRPLMIYGLVSYTWATFLFSNLLIKDGRGMPTNMESLLHSGTFYVGLSTRENLGGTNSSESLISTRVFFMTDSLPREAYHLLIEPRVNLGEVPGSSLSLLSLDFPSFSVLASWTGVFFPWFSHLFHPLGLAVSSFVVA